MGGSFIAEILCRLIPALNLEMSVALFASAQKRVCALTNGNFERRRRQPQLYMVILTRTIAGDVCAYSKPATTKVYFVCEKAIKR